MYDEFMESMLCGWLFILIRLKQKRISVDAYLHVNVSAFLFVIHRLPLSPLVY